MKKIIFIILALFSLSCSKGYVREPAPIVDDKEILVMDYDWDTFIGFGPEENETSGTIIANGDNLLLVSSSGVVYVVDKSGGRLEKIDLGEKVFANMTYQNDKVYLVSIKGNLIVLDIPTKKILKKFIGTTAFSAPLIEKGLIVIQTSDGGIIALNSYTLQQVWRFLDSNPSDLALWGNAELFFLQGFILAGLNDGRLIALELSSGRMVWQLSIGQAMIKTPDEKDLLENVRSNSVIYNMEDITANFVINQKEAILYAVPMKGYLTALSLKNLQQLWQAPMGAYLTPVEVADTLVVIDRRNYIYRLNANNGKTIWRNDNFKDRNLTKPVVIDGKYIAFGDGYGYMHLLDLTDGAYLGKKKVGLYGFVQNSIVYEDGRIYVLDKYGMLYSIYIDDYSNRRERGDSIWNKKVEKPVEKVKEEEKKPEKKNTTVDVLEKIQNENNDME